MHNMLYMVNIEKQRLINGFCFFICPRKRIYNNGVLKKSAKLEEIEKRKHEAEMVSDRVKRIKERLEKEGVKRATVYEMLALLIEETKMNSKFVMTIP